MASSPSIANLLQNRPKRTRLRGIRGFYGHEKDWKDKMNSKVPFPVILDVVSAKTFSVHTFATDDGASVIK